MAETFVIQVLFERKQSGRYYAHSPSVPGLHLAGENLETIRADVEPILKDLLFFNSNVVVDKFRWIPSLEEVQRRLHRRPSEEAAPAPVSPEYLEIVGHAA